MDPPTDETPRSDRDEFVGGVNGGFGVDGGEEISFRSSQNNSSGRNDGNISISENEECSN